MIDWLKDFEESFGRHGLITRLKEMKFHGKVEINFNEGNPLAVNIQMFCKPRTRVDVVVAKLPSIDG